MSNGQTIECNLLVVKFKRLELQLKSTDAALLLKARQGDRLAFRDLVNRHQQQVRTTVYSMLGDTAEVDDVAQEVFVRFYRSMSDFREEAKLSTYLTRIAINLSLNELKRRQRKQRILPLFWQAGEGSEEVMEIEDHSMGPGRFDLDDLIRKSLRYLSPEYRAVVVLRLVEGYSVADAAEILDLPQGTIASRLARAQKKLKGIIERWEQDEKTKN